MDYYKPRKTIVHSSNHQWTQQPNFFFGKETKCLLLFNYKRKVLIPILYATYIFRLVSNDGFKILLFLGAI